MHWLYISEVDLENLVGENLLEGQDILLPTLEISFSFS